MPTWPKREKEKPPLPLSGSGLPDAISWHQEIGMPELANATGFILSRWTTERDQAPVIRCEHDSNVSYHLGLGLCWQ